jgi:hypothetical protein
MISKVLVSFVLITLLVLSGCSASVSSTQNTKSAINTYQNTKSATNTSTVTSTLETGEFVISDVSPADAFVTTNTNLTVSANIQGSDPGVKVDAKMQIISQPFAVPSHSQKTEKEQSFTGSAKNAFKNALDAVPGEYHIMVDAYERGGQYRYATKEWSFRVIQKGGITWAIKGANEQVDISDSAATTYALKYVLPLGEDAYLGSGSPDSPTNAKWTLTSSGEGAGPWNVEKWNNIGVEFVGADENATKEMNYAISVTVDYDVTTQKVSSEFPSSSMYVGIQGGFSSPDGKRIMDIDFNPEINTGVSNGAPGTYQKSDTMTREFQVTVKGAGSAYERNFMVSAQAKASAPNSRTTGSTETIVTIRSISIKRIYGSITPVVNQEDLQHNKDAANSEAKNVKVAALAYKASNSSWPVTSDDLVANGFIVGNLKAKYVFDGSGVIGSVIDSAWLYDLIWDPVLQAWKY